MSKATERLESAIIAEGDKTGYWNKVGFYTGKSPRLQPTHFEDPAPDIKTALKEVSWLDRRDPDTRVLIAVAGAFMWGEPSPQISRSDRTRIENKILQGIGLTPAENLWVITQQVDTDMF
jgi:hypothetical protein